MSSTSITICVGDATTIVLASSIGLPEPTFTTTHLQMGCGPPHLKSIGHGIAASWNGKLATSLRVLQSSCAAYCNCGKAFFCSLHHHNSTDASMRSCKLKIPVTSNRSCYMEDFFWNPSYGRPWTIPKTISKTTTSFSSLTTLFLFLIITASFSYELS